MSARAELDGLLRTRETAFLDLVRRLVYPRPANPFRRLLDIAGCEYGDLARLVRTEGLEGALEELYRPREGRTGSRPPGARR
jgi:hypothetical protein